MTERTFELRITGTENYEWQGTLCEGGKERQSFRSVLELLREINYELEQKAE